MKTRNTFINARRTSAGLSRARRATKAQAIVVIGRPVGITFGQTARVTAANTGTRAIVVDWTVLDSEGTVLGN